MNLISVVFPLIEVAPIGVLLYLNAFNAAFLVFAFDVILGIYWLREHQDD